MLTTEYLNYREFLKSRYDFLKISKSSFSARFFAKKAGLASTSYFRMVVTGQRKLSSSYALKFSKGLSLTVDETKILLNMVELEQDHDQPTKERLIKEIKILRQKIEKSDTTLSLSHVEILSDLQNLKLYLLAQSQSFKLNVKWLSNQFNNEMNDNEIENRIQLLITSGLWKIENGQVKTLAPTVRTGDCLAENHLAQTHINILAAAQKSVKNQSPKNRILGGRTILFNKNKMSEVAKKIDEFKAQIESEYEDTLSKDVYELHVSFFEI